MFHGSFNLRGLWFYFAIQEEYVSIVDILEDREKHRKEKKNLSPIICHPAITGTKQESGCFSVKMSDFFLKGFDLLEDRRCAWWGLFFSFLAV